MSDASETNRFRPGARPAFTVVIMGYRNEPTIVASVASVLAQHAPEPFEVVVVTSGGDRSAARVREAFPELPVLDVPHRLLPGGARNAGTEIARGEHVAFLAADCVAEPGWLVARLRAHRARHPVVSGAVANADPQRPWGWAALYLFYHDRLAGRPAGPVAWPDPAAHGLSFERDLLRTLGPFDATLGVGEDSAMARTLAERGIPVWFEPAARIAHRGPASTRALLADLYRRGARFVNENRIPPPGDGSWPALFRAEADRFWLRLRAVLRRAWRHSPKSERARVLVALPWIVAGLLALRAGRLRAFREQIASGLPSSRSDPRP